MGVHRQLAACGQPVFPGLIQNHTTLRLELHVEQNSFPPCGNECTNPFFAFISCLKNLYQNITNPTLLLSYWFPNRELIKKKIILISLFLGSAGTSKNVINECNKRKTLQIIPHTHLGRKASIHLSTQGTKLWPNLLSLQQEAVLMSYQKKSASNAHPPTENPTFQNP